MSCFFVLFFQNVFDLLTRINLKEPLNGNHVACTSQLYSFDSLKRKSVNQFILEERF